VLSRAASRCLSTQHSAPSTSFLGDYSRVREKTITLRTSAREQILIITDEVNRALATMTSGDGVCTIVVPHTTAAISVNENADPDVPADLTNALRALVPNIRFHHA